MAQIIIRCIRFYNSVLHNFQFTQFGGRYYLQIISADKEWTLGNLIVICQNVQAIFETEFWANFRREGTILHNNFKSIITAWVSSCQKTARIT